VPNIVDGQIPKRSTDLAEQFRDSIAKKYERFAETRREIVFELLSRRVLVHLFAE